MNLTEEHNDIYQGLRAVNESLSALWLNLKPVFSNTVKSIATKYHLEEDCFVIVLNEEFWAALNYHDKCFVVSSEMLKMIFEHKKRAVYFFDKDCAAASSSIVTNEFAIKHIRFNYSAMSIKKRLRRIDNMITEDLRDFVKSNPSLEIIYAVLLKIKAQRNSSLSSSPEADNAGSSNQPCDDASKEKPEQQAGAGSGEDDLEPQAGAGDGADVPDDLASEDESTQEQGSGQGGAGKSPPADSAGGEGEDGEVDSGSGEGSATDDIGDGEGDGQDANEPTYTDLDPNQCARLINKIEETLTEKALNKDFGDEADDFKEYLEKVVNESEQFAEALELKDPENKIEYAISGLGEGIAKDYWLRIESTKKAKLKKIIQRHMKYSDEPEEEEQFMYKDEMFALLGDSIKIPSMKELGANKQSKRHIVLYLDSSGSCNQYAADFVRRLVAVKMADIQLDVYTFDTKVKELKIPSTKRFNLNINTSGGTAFHCVVRHANEALKNKKIDKHSVFVILTDGFDGKFTADKQAEIKNKKSWYWFLTTPAGRKDLTDCGNLLDLKDFI